MVRLNEEDGDVHGAEGLDKDFAYHLSSSGIGTVMLMARSDSLEAEWPTSHAHPSMS
jgi:hypothetical protein